MTRFRSTKGVGQAGHLSLAVVLLGFGLLSVVIGARIQAPSSKFTLAAGAATFTVSSTIYTTPSGPYPAASCAGTPATLTPGLTRCVVFSVQNNLSVPITVQTISSALDSSFPTPPPQCAGSNLTLPSFSGSLAVAANGTADSPGEPIELNDSTTDDQTACEGFDYHFAYSGTAQYTDSTTTVLAASAGVTTSGSSVTFTATVTADNASADPILPSGSVDFYSCPTVACASTTLLGTGTVNISNGQATFATSSLPIGITFVVAVYQGSGTDFSASPPSNVLTQQVNASTSGGGAGSSTTTTTTTTTAPPTASGGSTVTTALPNGSGASTSSGPPTKAAGGGGSLAFTGAQISWLAAGGLSLILAGLLAIGVVRRRTRGTTS